MTHSAHLNLKRFRLGGMRRKRLSIKQKREVIPCPFLSAWLIGQNHFHKTTHLIQDYLVENLKDSSLFDELAGQFFTICRSLTRLFKRNTGYSIQTYRENLRIHHAEKLLEQTMLSIEEVAFECGYESSRSFRRFWSRYLYPKRLRFRCAECVNFCSPFF